MKRVNVLKVMFLLTVAALFYILHPQPGPAAAGPDSEVSEQVDPSRGALLTP